MEIDKFLDYELESAFGFDLLDNTDFMLEPTTEGLVIKNRNITNMENCVAQLHNRVKNMGDIEISAMALNLAHSEEIKELELLIQKEFGFGWVDVGVSGSMLINAKTVIDSAVISRVTTNMPKLPIEHGRRYYNSNHNIYACIGTTAGMFSKLEPDEIMAILLHEIGHLFDITVSTYLVDLVFWIMSVSNGGGAMLQKLLAPALAMLGVKLEQWLDYLVIPAVLSNLFFIGCSIITKVLGPLGGVTTIYELAKNFTSNLSPASTVPFFNFAGERFADSFVTAYGYGDALIQATDKIDKQSSGYMTGSNKVLEYWSWSGGALIVPLMILLDPHPENQTRCKLILEDCEKAMKDPSMPPKMRPIAKQRYKLAKDAYDKYLKMPDDEKANAGARFARATKEKLFNGKMDFRSYIFTLSAALTRRQ